MGAIARITSAVALTVAEDGDTGNAQTYAVARDIEIEGTTNTVLQIRLDLDDYVASGDEPVLKINLGYSAGTFTVTPATDFVNFSADHLREAGDEVYFESTGGLPGGLSTGVTYFFLTVPGSNTATISLQPGGSTYDITAAAGTGTHSWYGFGTESGVQVTEYSYFGGGGSEPAFPAVTIKDQRSGGRDDFRRLKAFQLVLIPTDPTLAAAALVWVSCGVNTDRRSYFVIPLEFAADANSNGCAQFTAALPVGWNYSDTNPFFLTIESCANASVILNFMGQ